MRLRFADFEIDLESHELTRDGEVLPLAPQPAKVLALLASHPGSTLTRKAIREHVWGTSHVEADLGLNSCIRKIRAQLGDDPRRPRFIQTLPRRGYRFVAPVQRVEPAPGDIAARRPGRRLAVAVAGLLAAGLLLGVLMGRRAASRPEEGSVAPSERVLVAVLPFANLTGDSGEAYVSDGLTEGVIADLGRIDPSRIAVIARTTRGDRLGGAAPGPRLVASVG